MIKNLCNCKSLIGSKTMFSLNKENILCIEVNDVDLNFNYIIYNKHNIYSSEKTYHNKIIRINHDYFCYLCQFFIKINDYEVEIRIDRYKINDIIDTDISVSRNHAIMIYNKENGKLILEN